jgi:thioredoxin reductase (NADPH)
MSEPDIVIVGGGPAGLTAAIYLARCHLRTIVIDSGKSRALMIPISHNHAGHPAGIAGRVLVDRMRTQELEYGATIIEAQVTSIVKAGAGFRIEANGQLRARGVLLATGVHNHRPAIDDALHDEAVAKGLLRYCPICDGYEVTDRRIGVIGSGSRGMREALFMRSFSSDITLVAPQGPHGLDSEQLATLVDAGIHIIHGPARDFRIDGDTISFATATGRRSFDTVYPALGSAVQSDLAQQLGADLCEDECIRVDSHQRTSVKGLYAAGDVVLGLDQISNAMGEAGVAATAIRNDLAEIYPLRR